MTTIKTLIKKLSALTFVFTLLFSSTALTQDKLSSEERETAKEELSQAYNLLVTMDAKEYSEMLRQGADQARQAGETKRAQVLEKLAHDPQSRNEITGQIQQKIESQSENGLFLALYLWTPSYWCYYGDIPCLAMIAVLATVTLDGEPAAQY